MEVVVYTDASHCHVTKICACGFIALQFRKIIKHEVTIYQGVKRNSDAEHLAISKAFQYSFLLEDVSSIVVYTEMEDIINWNFKPKTIEKNPYLKEIIDIVEIIREHGICVEFRKVKAHSNDNYNTKVDISVRKALRDHLRYFQGDKIYIRKLPEKSNLFGYYDNWY